jgi:hypothetical protein
MAHYRICNLLQPVAVLIEEAMCEHVNLDRNVVDDARKAVWEIVKMATK